MSTGLESSSSSRKTYGAEDFGREGSKDLTVYREIAEACGYTFRVGVISEAHRAALLEVDNNFDIVVTGCR